MSALRRDLFQRKLWLVLVVLVAAIVAVPLLLLKSSSAGGAAPPLPPSAAPVSALQPTASPHAKTVPAKVLLASIPRDPFAAGEPKLSAKPTAAGSSAASTSTTTTATATSATTTQAAMVSPSPATSSGTATSSSATSSATATTPSTATTAAVPPTPSAPAATPTWTIYSVSVRFGKNAGAPVRDNLAWLTPLPADQPAAMFMGVVSGGQQAVFALASGVGHWGPGLCRPNHDVCSDILLKAGQTERLTVPTAGGSQEHAILRLVQIGSTVTHSRKVALKAYDRYSTAGLCDLGGQEPILYDPESGTVQNVPKATCRNERSLSNLFSYPKSGS